MAAQHAAQSGPSDPGVAARQRRQAGGNRRLIAGVNMSYHLNTQPVRGQFPALSGGIFL
jgi:hypothetical protein